MAQDFSYLALAPGMETVSPIPFSGVVFGHHFPTSPHFIEWRQDRGDTLAARLVRHGKMAPQEHRTGALGLFIDGDKPESDGDKPKNVTIHFARNIDKIAFDHAGHARFPDTADILTRRIFPLGELQRLTDSYDDLQADPVRDFTRAEFMARLGGNLLINVAAADTILAILDNRLDPPSLRAQVPAVIPFYGIQFEDSFPGMENFGDAHAVLEPTLKAELKKSGAIVVPGYRGQALGLMMEGAPDNGVAFKFVTDADALFSRTRKGRLDDILRKPQAPKDLLQNLARTCANRTHPEIAREGAEARFMALLGAQQVLVSRPTAATLLKILANRFGRA